MLFLFKKNPTKKPRPTKKSLSSQRWEFYSGLNSKGRLKCLKERELDWAPALSLGCGVPQRASATILQDSSVGTGHQPSHKKKGISEHSVINTNPDFSTAKWNWFLLFVWVFSAHTVSVRRLKAPNRRVHSATSHHPSSADHFWKCLV